MHDGENGERREYRPSPALFRQLIEQVRDLTGSVYS